MSHQQTTAAPIKIQAIGAYLPENRESNVARMADFALTTTFLEEKLGVMERAIKQPDEQTSDLCCKAFADLQAHAPIDLSKIQVVTVVTQNPDLKIPYTAAILHQKLGLGKQCMTFDIAQGCAGYTHALAVLSGLMTSLHLDHALLFTCDPYSTIIDRNDKNTALLFGDGATVSYLSRTGPGYALVQADFGTVPGSAACLQCRESFEMEGRTVFNNAVREVPPSIESVLARAALSADAIDLYLLHQASKLVVDYIRQSLAIPVEKAPFAIRGYGNTVSSSIPLLLKPVVQQKTHQRLILSGFGVGFSWGTCLIALSA